jgi:hypothetical protein
MIIMEQNWILTDNLHYGRQVYHGWAPRSPQTNKLGPNWYLLILTGTYLAAVEDGGGWVEGK